MTDEAKRSVEDARAMINAANRVVVLTGAGISTDSGIPDFRGPNGVWTKNPAAEKTSTLQHYLGDPEVRRNAWQTRLQSVAWEAQPNDGHRALVALEQRGMLDTLVTQNIDELHQRAGTSADKVVEVHGTMRRYICWSCKDTGPMNVMLERVRNGEPDPLCLLCGGIVKSATISFGQNLVPEVIDRAFACVETCDLLLVIGTTLQVYPVANMVPVAYDRRIPIIILNGEPTAKDDQATVILRGSASDLLHRIVA